MKLRIVLGVASLLFLATVQAGDVLVYTGDGALNEGYTDFGAATGKIVDTQAVLPADLSGYDCIVLPINANGFSDGTKAALDGYVNAGGRIMAVAEWNAFPGGITTMNDLATYVGADLFVVSDAIDLGFNTTANIHPSPFTAGVASIRYAATSEVQVFVGPHAHSLVGTATTDTTFIGVDRIGSGAFFLFGDSNVLSDNNGNGYVTDDNGVFAANICDEADFLVVDIDIKFCSDPNAFNCKKKGVLPVTIFGTDDFDVADIDISSLQLCTADLSACTNAPLDWSTFDRGAPSDAGVAQCAIDPFTGLELDWTDNQDGYDDLDVAFGASEVQAMLGSFCADDKGAISDPLIIVGNKLDGTPLFSDPVPNVGIDQLWKSNK